MFRLKHSHLQAVTWVYLKPTYDESVNIYFCTFNKRDVGYIRVLGETVFVWYNKYVGVFRPNMS